MCLNTNSISWWPVFFWLNVCINIFHTQWFGSELCKLQVHMKTYCKKLIHSCMCKVVIVQFMSAFIRLYFYTISNAFFLIPSALDIKINLLCFKMCQTILTRSELYFSYNFSLMGRILWLSYARILCQVTANFTLLSFLKDSELSGERNISLSVVGLAGAYLCYWH